MKDGSKYDISEKPHWFNGSQESWEKYNNGRDNKPSQANSNNQSQPNPPQETIEAPISRRNNTNNHDSELTEDDKARLWDLEYRSISLEIETTDSKDVVALKNEINQIKRFLMANRRNSSDIRCSAQKNKLSYGDTQYFLTEKEKEKESLEKKLEDKLLSLKKQYDEEKRQILRRDFLACCLVDVLRSYYRKTSKDDDSQFVEVGITPLRKINGEKAYGDGKFLIDILLVFFNMTEGFPRGWKHAEYLLGKMGIKPQEIIDARVDVFILN
jgi:hypothetical protein